MGKKNKKQHQDAIPTLSEYLKKRAQAARDSAAFELHHQEAPKTPFLPRTSGNLVAKVDALSGTPDNILIERYGIEADPANCIYNSTINFGENAFDRTGKLKKEYE